MSLLRRFGSLAGMLGILVFFSVMRPETFPTLGNWLNISQQVSMLLVVAVTMTVVMAMGDFDLSVGAMASLAGVIALVAMTQGWPPAAAVAIALAAGLLGGVVNGALVSLAGLLPFVATLASMTVFSGLAAILSDGRTISGADVPVGFTDLDRGGWVIAQEGERLLRLPPLTLAALGVTFLAWLVLEQTSYGRRLYAIGGNAVAARLAGVPVAWLRLTAFAITGLGAAVAGLMYAVRVDSANPVQGDGLMLSAIAAVFLGQSLTESGQPRVWATLAGVVVLGALDNGLTQLAVDSYVREVLVGVIIVLAVGISALARRGQR